MYTSWRRNYIFWSYEQLVSGLGEIYAIKNTNRTAADDKSILNGTCADERG